jgi:Tol biopolymer transport system component
MTRAEIASARGTRSRRGLRLRGLAVFGLVALVLLAGRAQAAPNDVSLISRAAGASGAKSNGQSFTPSLSRDGQFVAFDSKATNLVPEDSDAFSDVYVRDLRTGTTTLVSRASGASGAKGNFDSDNAAISADGRFVAFESDASNLSHDDSDKLVDVYVRDLQTRTNTLVSRGGGRAAPRATATPTSRSSRRTGASSPSTHSRPT